MSIQDTYTSHIILSLFTRANELKTSQLFHILNGKRTASTLFQALDAHLLNVFSLFDSISRKEFEQMIFSMTRQGWIKETAEQTFQLTASGQKELAIYFAEHYIPKQLNSLRYAKLSQPVWERLQLITQVFSEKSYQNRQYIPVIKKHAQQRWCKRWMHHYSKSNAQTARQLADEWRQVFEQIDQDMANSIAMRLTGHRHIGVTHNQIAQKMQMENTEMRMYFLDTLHFMYSIIEKNKDKLKIFSNILKQTDLETHVGLSESTWKTWRYLQAGDSIEKIAQMRKLKIGTVREHIIELAIVQDNFPICQYVPEDIRQLLHGKMEQDKQISFQQMLEIVPDLPFHYYRLVQIERRR